MPRKKKLVGCFARSPSACRCRICRKEDRREEAERFYKRKRIILDVGVFLKANPHIIRDEIDKEILADLRKTAKAAWVAGVRRSGGWSGR